MTLIGAIAISILLPRENKFVRSEGLLASGRQMLRAFPQSQLLATYGVGFGVLFNFIVTFTYLSFRLAAAPYNLSATWLGVIFVVYLVGSATTPLTGWALTRYGRRRFTLRVLALWGVGILLTLAGPLWLIVLGLTLCAGCGLMCQSISTGYVTITAKAGRSSAVGLYVTSFYLGGSVGAALGGVGWTLGGWITCVAMVTAMLAIMAAIVWLPGRRACRYRRLRRRSNRRDTRTPKGETNETDKIPDRLSAVDRHADRVQPHRNGGAGAARPRLHGAAPALPLPQPAADGRLRQDRHLPRARQGRCSATTCRSGSIISTMSPPRRTRAG